MRNDVLNLGDLSLNGRNERGYILITTMIALGVVAVLATSALGWALTGLRLSRKAVESEQAFYMANAGIEEALARVLAGQPPVDFSQLRPVGAGLSGTYSVTMRVNADQSITVESRGSVGGTTRLATARMLPGTSGGTDPGTPGGGTGEAAQPPPGVPAQVFAQAVYSNGSLAFDNNAVVCGDLSAVGSVLLGNGTRVLGTVGSGCSTVVGTGKLVATGLIDLGNNSYIAGGWCDAAHWGTAGHPCPSKPSATPLAYPDLSSQATVQVPGSLTLSGTQTYNHDIVYVGGNLAVDKKGVAISGSVTFAVKGTVDLNGSLTCSGACSVAIVTQGDIRSLNNLQIWSSLITNARLSLGNQVTIHGNLQAGSSDTLNGTIIYPIAVGTAPAPPPAGNGTGPGLTDWNS